MTDDELKGYLERGIFPLPEESEEAFLQRIRRFPQFDPKEEQLEAGRITRPLFGFSADWMPIVYSNKKLPFWEGAATWIDPNAFPYVQLRVKFQKGSYLGLKRDQVVAHEAVHAVRMLYNEPVFEEVLAYQTSPQRWRRIVGPLFRYPAESLLFLVALAAGVFCAMLGTLFVLTLPAAMALYFSARLSRVQWAFRRARKVIPLSVLVWMADAEVRKAKMPLDRSSLRSRALRLAVEMSAEKEKACSPCFAAECRQIRKP